MKPELKITVKAWKRFGDEYKIHMQRKFDVILVDHQTKSERIVSVLRKFNARNLNNGINKFNRGIDSFHDMMDDLDKSLKH